MPRKDRLALRRFLKASLGTDLRPDPARLATAAEGLDVTSWRALPAASDSHGLTLHLDAEGVSALPGCPAAVASDLRARSLAHRANMMRADVALERLAPVLDRSAAPWALLKGAVLADLTYSLPRRRSFSDIDVLVAPRAVEAALTALESDGAVLLTRNWELLRSTRKAELVLRMPNGMVVDLHWNLLGSPTDTPGLRFRTDALLSRSARATIFGTEVGVLSPVDHLLHVTVHAVLAGGGPLRLALDIDQTSRHAAVDTQDLASRLRQTGASLPVLVGLARTASVLGRHAKTDDLMRAADPRGGTVWRTLSHGIDRINPPSRSHEAIPMQFLTGLTRDTTLSSVRAAAGFTRVKSRHLRDVSDFRQRLLHGIQQNALHDEELQAVDGGHRDALLRELSTLR